MITIDGSKGEGGGQILRSALGLSLVSQRPFCITNIRANRKKPGLMRQHLTAVRAAAKIGAAQVENATIGSRELVFSPGKISHGSYHFSIGTAGSCTLVFQAILPALLVAEAPSTIVLEGGTHNPFAPPFDFLEITFLPILRKMGADIEAKLDKHGFYPAGGGKITITVKPAKKLQPIELQSITNLYFSAKAVCADLPVHIAQRELKVVKSKLEVEENHLHPVMINNLGPGNILTVFAHSDQLSETFTGFGQKNLSAEQVARKTVNQAKKYRKTHAPVGPFLADQLLIPFALAGSGKFCTGTPTNHTSTNIEVIQQFLDVSFSLVQKDDTRWEIAL